MQILATAIFIIIIYAVLSCCHLPNQRVVTTQTKLACCSPAAAHFKNTATHHLRLPTSIRFVWKRRKELRPKHGKQSERRKRLASVQSTRTVSLLTQRGPESQLRWALEMWFAPPRFVVHCSRFGVWPDGQHRRAVRDGRPPTPPHVIRLRSLHSKGENKSWLNNGQNVSQILLK
jgi:hypothetical protein